MSTQDLAFIIGVAAPLITIAVSILKSNLKSKNS